MCDFLEMNSNAKAGDFSLGLNSEVFMAFKDILVTLTSYPQPTPVSTVEDAVSVAAALGAHIAALSCEMNVQLPGHFISGSMVGLPELSPEKLPRADEMRKT